MEISNHNEAQRWLRKADEDLDAARELIRAGTRHGGVVVYLCQQVFEKALKASLVFHGSRAPKTHDLTLLVGLCAEKEMEFGRWMAAAEQMTPYAVLFRYPGEPMVPEMTEILEAVQSAADVLDFVTKNLGIESRTDSGRPAAPPEQPGEKP